MWTKQDGSCSFCKGAGQASITGCTKPGVEPDWVVRTSIGAINSAIIEGNEPEVRLDKLIRF